MNSKMASSFLLPIKPEHDYVQAKIYDLKIDTDYLLVVDREIIPNFKNVYYNEGRKIVIYVNVREDLLRKYFSDELSEEDIKITEILHGFVGYMIARDELKIEADEILEAIKYHTIGKKGLSKLGRVIYIADGIEKNRDYPNVDKIREITDRDLDEGIIYEIDRKIEYLDSCGGKIHKNTLEMRDWLKSLRG